MIDRVRAFLARPIADAARPRLFALVAVALVLVAGGFFALDGDDGQDRTAQQSAGGGETAEPPEPIPAPEEPENAADLPVPSEETPLPEGETVTRKDVNAAKQVAQRFLGAYLLYTYGRAEASEIPAATAELRSQLEREPPRVPPSERGREAEVQTLQVDGASERRMGMLALVDDGARTYTVALAMALEDSGWKVTEVGA